MKNDISKFEMFLLVILSHFVSLLGSSMTKFALGIWVYQITGQVMNFAFVLVASYLPSVLISPFAGVWIDRKGSRLFLLLGSLIGLTTLGLTQIVTLYWDLNLMHIIIIAVSLAIVSAIEVPSLHTLTPKLVETEKLTRANGLLSTATSTTTILGPILAGALIGFTTINIIIAINFITFMISLLFIVVLWKKLDLLDENVTNDKNQKTFLTDLKSGFTYVFEFKALFAMIMLHTILNVSLGINSVIRQPYILSFSTAEQFGIITSLFGVGMMLGGLLMSFIKIKRNYLPIIYSSIIIMGLCVLFTGINTNLLVVGALWILMGFSLPICNSLSISLIQNNTNESYLGRVFSISRMLSWVTLPIAYLGGALLADQLVRIENSFSLLSYLNGAYATLLIVAGSIIVLTVVYFKYFTQINKLAISKNSKERRVIYNIAK